jgi:hypothetical protein
MIVQPFVENAIEHGLRPRQEGRLTIRFEVMPDDEFLLKCTIEDDGVGFNKGQEKAAAQAGAGFQKHRSRGMEITHERLLLLHQIQKRPGDKFIMIQDLADITPQNNLDSSKKQIIRKNEPIQPTTDKRVGTTIPVKNIRQKIVGKSINESAIQTLKVSNKELIEK